jgi:hypothetical protein
LGKPLDRFAGARVALDGSNGTAVHATARHVPPDKRTQLLAQIAQRRAGSLEDLDAQESPDEAGPPGGAVAEQVPAKREALQPRQRLATAWQAQ